MGIFNWVAGKGKAAASGAKSFTRKITSADELEKNGKFIVDMVKNISTVPEAERLETFQNAYIRLGLDEEKLEQNYKFFLIRFRIFLGFSILGLGLLIWNLVNFSFAFLACIGFLAYCLAQTFIGSFRILQINKRELVSVSYWLKNKKHWWPKPFVANEKRSLYKIKKRVKVKKAKEG